MNIIGYRKIFLLVSSALVLLSILAIAFFGLHRGIDFLGGTQWQLKINNGNMSQDEVRNFFERNLKEKNVSVYADTSTNSIIVRLSHISEANHQQYLKDLEQKFSRVEEQRFDAIGPAVGKSVENRAVWAIVLVLIGISLYVTFAFRKVSYPIKSWKYGVITLITLFHDAIIPIGLFAVLGYFLGVEVDINFVVAVLVVMGFSVHDTIVVFDRIRENLLVRRQGLDFESLSGVINSSINQTIARSINTSLTLVIVLLSLLFLGPVYLRYFMLTILVGVTVGAYSSIFVASPTLLITSRAKSRKIK